MFLPRNTAILFVFCVLSSISVADEQPPAPDPSSKWCPPNGPTLPKTLSADSAMKPGWVTLRMQVRPGAVPVSDVRVVSEAGGSGHARAWLPLVRQWIGCATNERDTLYSVKFTLGVEGVYQLPAKEGFGPLAFLQPRGIPALPAGDIGVGVCPIRATLQLRQPEAKNVVLDFESKGGAAVTDWLERLIPNREYMAPAAQGNRIEFDCKVSNGAVSFYDN